MANPASYISTNDIQQKWTLQAINNFIEDLQKISGKCMDVGCGPGDITKSILLPLLDSNATMIGTDISEIMIEYANKSYADEKRIKFEVLNIETKDLPKKYMSEFDHVFSFHVVHWCKDIRQAFKNIHHMLRPNGTMLITMLASFKTIEETFRVFKQHHCTAMCLRYDREYLIPFHSSTQPLEDLKKLLNDVGFTVQYCRIHEMMLTEKNMENVISSVFALFLNETSDNVKEDFLKDFKRIYEEARIKYYVNDSRFYSDNKEGQTVPIDLHEIFIIYAQKNLL